MHIPAQCTLPTLPQKPLHFVHPPESLCAQYPPQTCVPFTPCLLSLGSALLSHFFFCSVCLLALCVTVFPACTASALFLLLCASFIHCLHSPRSACAPVPPLHSPCTFHTLPAPRSNQSSGGTPSSLPVQTCASSILCLSSPRYYMSAKNAFLMIGILNNPHLFIPIYE